MPTLLIGPLQQDYPISHQETLPLLLCKLAYDLAYPIRWVRHFVMR